MNQFDQQVHMYYGFLKNKYVFALQNCSQYGKKKSKLIG